MLSIHKDWRTSFQIVFLSLILLFFFQLISDFVEAIYAFGLLGTSIPVEIISVLFLFTPVLLLLLPRGKGSKVLIASSGFVMLACRVVEVMVDTRGRMILSGIGVGCFLLFLPSWIWMQSRRREESAGYHLGAGLTLAVGLSILFRAWGSGSDLTTIGMFKLIGWFLAVLAGALLLVFIRAGADVAAQADQERVDQSSLSWTKITGLSLGVTAVLILLYFAFTSPNVIARWTGVSFLTIEIVILFSLSLLAYVLSNPPFLSALIRPVVLWSSNILFVGSLVWTIGMHQIRFPSDPAAYPLAEPVVSWLQYIPLLIMLITFPIILVDFLLFSRELVADRPNWLDLAIGFTVSSLLMLVMMFSQVFTTVYDYIPVIGPFFRDKFWLVFLVPGIILLLALRSLKHRPLGQEQRVTRHFAGVVIVVGVATVAGFLMVSARPADPTSSDGTVRVLTYNIQQGYSENGQKNFDGQIKLIRQVDADIVGLQESDTNRIAGGDTDLVRYFADRLNLFSYYGPKVVPGTFGIAMLSKYPIENPRTFFMYSEGEQTATIAAKINVNGQIFNVFVTHLGNSGPIVQQEAILQEVVGKENVILMGDFNFRPETDQYVLTTEELVDSWLLRWPEGIDEQGMNPDQRIDHIFVSPSMTVRDIRYLDGPESDHPAVMADLE